MVYIAGENEDFIYIYNLLNKFNHQIALDYLRLIVFDVILYNVDRHNENCGILRNNKTGAIISLAPNYDNNLCLISRTKELKLSRNEGFLDLFVKTIRKNSTFCKICIMKFITIHHENHKCKKQRDTYHTTSIQP